MNRDEALPSFFIVLAWWIVAFLLFWLVSWSTASLDQRSLARSVDAAFSKAHDGRRVSAPLPAWGPDGAAALAGRRFSLKSKNEVAVAFTVNGAGAAASFVAVYAEGRGIVSVLPLYENAQVLSDRLPAGLLESYLHRIEATETRREQKEADAK